jgi:hypothetical protein
MQRHFISPEPSTSDDEDDLNPPLPSLDISLLDYLGLLPPPQAGVENEPEDQRLADTRYEDTLLPPSSDGPIRSSPVKGTKEEKHAIRRKKAANKQKATIAKNLEEAKRLEVKELAVDAEEVLKLLEQKGRRFGELLKYVFDPNNSKGHVRWHQFFAYSGEATEILDWWVSSKNSDTARNEVKEWAVNYVSGLVSKEAKKVVKSKVLQTRDKVIDQEFVRAFSFSALNTKLKELAPVGMHILEKLSTSPHAEAKHMDRRKERTTMVSISVTSSLRVFNNSLGHYFSCPHLLGRI